MPHPDAVRLMQAFINPLEVVTFQTFDDTDAKSQELARISHFTLEKMRWQNLEQLNARQVGVFWTVNATDGRGRKAKNVTRVRAVFADLDGSPLDPVTACELPPTAIVESSAGRWHAYWKVSDVPLEAFERLQIGIAQRFSGDASIKDLSRVMRLPNFLHQKQEPYRTRLLEVHPERVYTLEQVSAAFPMAEKQVSAARPAPTPAPAAKAAKQSRTLTDGDPLSAYVKKALETECDNVRQAPQGAGNNTLNKAAFALGQFISAGVLTESAARDALESAVSSWAKRGGSEGATIDSGLSAGKLEPRDLSQIGQRGNAAGAIYTPRTGEQKDKRDTPEVTKHSPTYAVIDGKMSKLEIPKGDDPFYRKLCNFSATISAETMRDDGSGTAQNLFTITGALETGESLPTIDVASAQYGSLNWVTAQWGARAAIQPSQNTRAVLAHGIQTMSLETMGTRKVYTHTGWRNLEPHGWVYLHAGGAISSSGLVSDLEIDLGDLQRYTLPAPPEGQAVQGAVIKSLELLDLAPDAVTLPLWLSIWRAALGVTRFSVYLYGVTGEAKSGLAALFLSHYGQFTRHSLPGSWESTATSLERLLFTLKDAPCVIDDFNPRGSVQESKMLHSKADRVLRNQGNGSARQRSTWRNGALEAGVSYVPRGLCIVTGEDIPAGHSLRARNLILELGRGDVRKERFSSANQSADAGVLAGSMAAFLQWLAPNLETHQARLESRALELANSFQAAHGRTTDAAGDLMAALELWGAFALETECVTAQQLEMLTRRARVALQAVCGAQGAHQAAADPVHRFLELLPALFSSGKAHLQNSRTGQEPEDAQRWGWRERTIGTGDNQRSEWQPQGAAVGWVSETGAVMLEAQSVYAAVQRLAGEQGDGFTKSALSLWKALGERGLLQCGAGQNTVNRRVVGMQKRVLCLQPHALEVTEHAALELGKTQTPTVLYSSHVSHTPLNVVSDDVKPVTAVRGVTAVKQSHPESDNSRLEGVTESQQSQQKVSHGLDAVSHNTQPPVTDVTAVQTPTPPEFFENDDKVLI